MSRTDSPAGSLNDEAVLLVGHGSRREASNEQVRSLAADLEGRLGVPVDAGFLELAEPTIPDAIDALAPAVANISVVHLSLFAASHVKNDVPAALQRARSQHPEVEFNNGSHLGVHPAIVDLLDDRAADVEADLGVDRAADDVAVVLCARGSSDPDANADVHKLARLLYEGRAFSRVDATFIGVTEPTLDETLHDVAKHRPDAVVVVPYMLGDGVLTGRIREGAAEFDADYPYVEAACGDPLGTDSRLLDVLGDRWQEARTGSVEMSCDTCKYKVELDGYEEDVGGAKAMLRALNHQEAHEDRDDVADDPHAHDAPDRHVAVCTNQTCAAEGAPAVLERLRQEARDADEDSLRVTRTSCLGQCGDGPNVAVYPDGVWYQRVDPDDAGRIVSSHTDRDRIVSDLDSQLL
ncbi:CbiX/SirB N-terminal domain-containing protein [Halobacterium salinarum]|uniref:Sirohydrochlorin cobaltochelatase n=4 Tax=Halobacterium salinarum TaxID=2242 RepID=A0A510N765_HALSA|nr:CbiX/SirB N-terminal domain-containing protein [Halobacterium salinarum]MBB6088848.1 sirohydrochlorin ferrochelatase [Halobacterium salinarum]MDL0119470.1 NAD(P)H-dependent oxidoreductase subunit E [Halobacterium salinarum]MDL0142701.1 NAD(P)H-dependent oxidoreductase subunit E [Halobacterium salinarum]UEB91198.1 NAD(P)H-dependent oxidoreductase subunit E [Halobacterium salinarum NRC-34001]CAP14128.1 sirohydrochlorin cobaltochelatase [Halobacterium salinarum R1]